MFIHGFWSSPRTWDRLARLVESDADLTGVRVDRFGYESPKIRLPLSPTSRTTTTSPTPFAATSRCTILPGRS
ncbi:hypothetical protein AB0K00_14755 [Dactylosporangium sp. NPDC049525]|uniref:hypothetical protein n=1 Tax=Dactylosporangium sp. NPDC049525 TaxID=3154730 RepID=UPI003415F232